MIAVTSHALVLEDLTLAVHPSGDDVVGPARGEARAPRPDPARLHRGPFSALQISILRFTKRRTFEGLLADSQGRNLALTLLHVPCSLDSGEAHAPCPHSAWLHRGIFFALQISSLYNALGMPIWRVRLRGPLWILRPRVE